MLHEIKAEKIFVDPTDGAFTLLIIEDSKIREIPKARGIIIIPKTVFDYVYFFCELHQKFIEEKKDRWHEDNYRGRFISLISNSTGDAPDDISNSLSILGL